MGILTARVDALTAAASLAGARRTRANELADRLAECLAQVDRLSMFVAGDAAAIVEAAAQQPVLSLVSRLGATVEFAALQREAAERDGAKL
jgi:hypothetical protein